jgi:hypothetical protein
MHLVGYLRKLYHDARNHERQISHSKKKTSKCDKKMYIDLHVKYPLFLPEFHET